MKDGGFNVAVGSKDSYGLTSSAKDFMNKVGDGRFTSRASNANQTKVASGMAIICSE